MAKILSIEVGLTQFRVAELQQKGKKTRVTSCFTFPVPQGAVEDGYIRDTQTLGDALKFELSSRRIKTRKTVFVVTSSRVASREVRLPYVKEARLLSIIQANATDYFPIDVSKYVLSYSIIDVEENKEEKSRQYHIVVYASPKSISAAYQELANVAGLTVERMNYISDGIYNAVKEEFAQDAHILMKIEEKTTFIAIIRDGELVLQRNLNYGIDGAVEAVRAYPVFGRDLDFDSAMEVLRTRNCIRQSLDMDPQISEPADKDDFIREARREVTESLRYLVGNISRIMDYYISRNQNVEFYSIVCCGIGAEFIGLPELLSYELGQTVTILDSLQNVEPGKKANLENTLAPYIALIGSANSTVNLMEKTTKKQKEAKESMSGAWLVFVAGTLAAAALAGASVTMRIYQEKEQEKLNARIEEERSIEQVYSEYQSSKSKYEQFLKMYEYTNTPNEGLVEFIKEMEQKMPSSIVVETFNSTGTQVSFSMTVAGKREAAKVLMQLRSFESLADVTTTGIDEAEDQTVTMSVTCTYAEPAPLDVTE